MRSFAYITLLLCMCACGGSKQSPGLGLLPVVQRFAEDYAKAYDLELLTIEETGTRAEPGYALQFEARHLWKLEQTQACMLDGVHALARRIQGHDKSLQNFSVDRIDLSINFVGEDPLTQAATHISHAYFADGLFNYSVYDVGGDKLRKIYRETYFEALRSRQHEGSRYPFRLEH